MRILILNPPFIGKFSRASRSPAVTKGGTIYYPFWLAYAAGVLGDAGHQVRLIDAPADGLSLDDVISNNLDFSPQLIILDTTTPSICSDIKSAERLKRSFPDSFLVLVGTHASALPDEALNQSPTIDGVARREYDYTLRDLADALQHRKGLERIFGLSLKVQGRVVHNQDRPLIENLDELPFVSKAYQKHLNIDHYSFAAANHPMVMIITGRGCPNQCFFCVYPQTFHSRSYRTRSPENIVTEFQWICKNLPQVKEIGIEDDTFTANPNRARAVAKLLIENKNKIKWYCNVRPVLDYETLSLMKKAGCRMITTGFESGNQAILNNMRKGLTLEQMRNFVANAKKTGLLIHGCIMFGNPGETRVTIRESIDFAKELSVDSMQFYPLYVYPGTEAYDWAQKNHYLKTNDYSQWVTPDGYHNCVIDLPELPAEELVRLADQALKEYIFRPRYLFMKTIQAIKYPDEGIRTLKSALVFFRYLLKGSSPVTAKQLYQQWDDFWRHAGNRMTPIGRRITREKQRVISELLADKKNTSVIDIGCGMGNSLITLTELFPQAEGIDVSKTAIKACQTKGLAVRLAKLEEETEQYDLVFSDGLIEHFTDFRPSLRKMARLSRRYLMLAQTNQDAWVIKALRLLERFFRPKNVKEMDFMIRDFVQELDLSGFRLIASESLFLGGFKVMLFERKEVQASNESV